MPVTNYDSIKSVVARELQIDSSRISDDATIEDLGLDSLAFAEVIIAVEKELGRTIDTSEFAEDIQNDTPFRELVRLMETAMS